MVSVLTEEDAEQTFDALQPQKLVWVRLLRPTRPSLDLLLPAPAELFLLANSPVVPAAVSAV
jgi:hypothetical protein